MFRHVAVSTVRDPCEVDGIVWVDGGGRLLRVDCRLVDVGQYIERDTDRDTRVNVGEIYVRYSVSNTDVVPHSIRLPNRSSATGSPSLTSNLCLRTRVALNS